MRHNLNLLLAIVLLLVCAKTLNAQNERDFYLWNTIALQGPIGETYSYKLSAKNYYLANDQLRDQTYLDLALYRKMNGWLNLGLAFRSAQKVKDTGDIMEYRPQFIAKLELHSNKIKYQTTNRMEHRFFSDGDHYFRYYHNAFVHFPSFPKLPKPYLGEEVFTKLDGECIHMLRAYAGLHLLDHDHFMIDIFYALQHSKSDDAWSNGDILGLNLSFLL